MNHYEVVGGEPLVLRVRGATLPELFEEVAYAVFDQRWRLAAIPPTYSRPVIAAGDTVMQLLAAWLDELTAMSRVEGLAPSFFVVDRLEEGGVQGSAAGLPTESAPLRSAPLSELAPEVGAPLEVPDGWWVDVILPHRRPLRLV